jgi:hypothetical protein
MIVLLVRFLRDVNQYSEENKLCKHYDVPFTVAAIDVQVANGKNIRRKLTNFIE